MQLKIFVDHYTDFTYVHLMKDTTAESTLEAKNAYESLMKSYGHDVENIMQTMVATQRILSSKM